MRHAWSFCFYISLISFYLLCNYLFKIRALALLGALFYILEPRIFCQTFFNSLNIGFMSFYAISTYTLFTYLEKMSFRRAILHALACSILTDIRFAGILLPAVTLLFSIPRLIKIEYVDKKPNYIRLNIHHLQSYFLFAVLYLILIIALNPFFWSNPIPNMLRSFHETQLPLYMDAEYPFKWYSVPVWIAITTPLMYLFFFIIGLIHSSITLFKKGTFILGKKDVLIFLILFFLPIIAVSYVKQNSITIGVIITYLSYINYIFPDWG